MLSVAVRLSSDLKANALTFVTRGVAASVSSLVKWVSFSDTSIIVSNEHAPFWNMVLMLLL